MKKFILLLIVSLTVMIGSIANAQQGLYIAFPDNNYTATTEKISLIGSAPPDGQVLINNQVIPRSKKGHFAYQIILKLGENNIIVKYEKQEKIIKIVRKNTENVAPKDDFLSDSLTPGQDVARLPNELMCFSAIAPSNAQVSVKIADKTISLIKEEETVSLPPNLSALTQTNEPIATTGIGKYLGCAALAMARDYNYPLFQLAISDTNGKKITKSVPGKGKIKILSPDKLEIAQVKENNGIARTGPSTDYSRLTPLPKGTKASITGKEGDWLRLDYGGWINSKEVKIYPPSVLPKTIIRSIIAKQVEDATEIFFPLQVPVPIIAQQGENQLVLTLYNTTAQTDIIKLNPDPIINRIDWKQLAPGMVQYTLTLKGQQQWGYKVEYRGKNLVLIVRHSPLKNRVNKQTLEGIKILIDPGHGGKESGASGPTGYLEKDINLIMSKLIAKELRNRGANVYLTREGDETVSLAERTEKIDKIRPAIALSVHYNSLPDDGDFANVKGMGAFWYHPQASDLAVFLHNYIVEKARRKSYGVYWNNLALARPSIAPSVLLELGFMSNPEEFEWVVDTEEQPKLAKVIADGVTEWFNSN